MLFSMLRKGIVFFLLLLSINSYSDQQSNVTVKLPFGAAFISYVNYASDNASVDDWKTLTVGRSATQALNVGDLVLVATLMEPGLYRCDYFKVLGEDDVTIRYTGVAWDPTYAIDNEEMLKLFYRTSDVRSCDIAT
ncbi:hypothetical protein GCM10023116_42580 [Kistimonas scapharcae]|uniref:Uncharacterized protein n=1 Tax=Kistimonas scapharcae TaxID=1036133 RepID=A0ABP8V960_9GAMM